MAKGKKSGGRDFEKGTSGNPAGRTPVPEEVRKIRELTKAELTAIVHKYAGMTKAEITAATLNPDTPVGEMMVASIIARTIKDGDAYRWNQLMDRAVGKVKEKVEHSTPGDKPLVILTLPANGSEVAPPSPPPKAARKGGA
jgi:hypothetical protein